MFSISKEIRNNQLWLIHLFFFILFFSVPALNFYFLRLPALDFGIANQALFSFRSFHDYPSTLILQREQMPYLSLHFSLWVSLLSPFSYLFGAYTLLLFQSLALVFAGVYLIKIARFFQLNTSLYPFILFQFYAIWAIYAAIADGFHDNTLAACFVPALYLGFIKSDKKVMLLSFVAILMSKENMAIWMPALLLSFVLAANKLKELGRFVFILLLLNVLYFIAITQFIMPALNPTGKFEQLDRFSHLGSSFSAIVQHVFLHPIEMLKLLFLSHVQPDEMENIKHEFWWVLFSSGFVVVVFHPWLLIAFLPLLFQKLWNKEVAFWGINYHYAIEMATLLSIAVIHFLKRMKSFQWQRISILVLMLSTAGMTYFKMQQRVSVWYDAKKENIFSKEHYTSDINISLLNEFLFQIKQSDAVSTNSGLVPHLANRKDIFLFPRIENNCKLLLLKNCEDVYPLSQEDYQKEIAAISTAAISGNSYMGFHLIKIKETNEAVLYEIKF